VPPPKARFGIFDTISADGADAARQTQRRGRDDPAGSIRISDVGLFDLDYGTARLVVNYDDIEQVIIRKR
jgi:hypothetical protein